MRTYLITYDTAAPSRHTIATAIMQLGDAWARPLDATWYVQSNERPAVLENRLSTLLDGEDGLLIQEVESRAVLLNTALRWFRKRKSDGAAPTNIVAFPAPAALPEAKAAQKHPSRSRNSLLYRRIAGLISRSGPLISRRNAHCTSVNHGRNGRLYTVFPHGNPVAAAKYGVFQGRQRRKLAMSRSPSVWLFSGWNCVPARLSFPTIAVTGPP
jgi:hypothetical protein